MRSKYPTEIQLHSPFCSTDRIQLPASQTGGTFAPTLLWLNPLLVCSVAESMASVWDGGKAAPGVGKGRRVLKRQRLPKICPLSMGRTTWEATLQRSGGPSAGWLMGRSRSKDVTVSLAGGQHQHSKGGNTNPFFCFQREGKAGWPQHT